MFVFEPCARYAAATSARGACLAACGRAEEAVAPLEAALEMARRAEASYYEVEAVLHCLQNLAVLRQQLGDFNAALNYRLEAIRLAEEVHGPTSDAVLQAYNALAARRRNRRRAIISYTSTRVVVVGGGGGGGGGGGVVVVHFVYCALSRTKR